MWFLDDGQLVCRPECADPVLRALDAESAACGARRATGSEAKSVARLVGAPAAVAGAPAWATDYVSSSVTADPARHFHVLGVDFGDGERSPTAQFEATTRKVAALHEALGELGDTACELVLLRKCADVCRVVHL